MKLVRFGNWSTGAMLSDTQVLDLTASAQLPGRANSPAMEVVRSVLPSNDVSWDSMITFWDTVKPAIAELTDRAQNAEAPFVVHDLNSLQLLPPLPCPRTRVFALAANFADHASRALSVIRGTQLTEEQVSKEVLANPPAGFLVIPGTVVGHNAEIVPPPGQTKLDYEVEAAIVLGPETTTGQLRAWGYTAWNDISVRDVYFATGPRIDQGPLIWALQKNWKCGNAAGPWLVVEDDLDIQDLGLRTYVNGETRQDSSTAKMLNSFQAAYQLLSSHVGLQAGDMLVSGTPSGVAMESGPDGPYLRPGDVVEVEVGDTGTRLRNIVGQF